MSFGMKEGKEIGPKTDFLGDVYVCLDQAKRQAQEYKVLFSEEIYRLVAHGILHLLGYEHKTKKQREEMKEKEEYFISRMTETRLGGGR